MKKLICSLVVSIAILATPGFAMDWSAGKFGVSGGFISGDKLEVAKSETFKTEYEGMGISLSGDYQNNFNEQLGFNVGLGYGSQKAKGIKANLDYILLSSNLTYDVQSNIYVYGGLNFPLTVASLEGDPVTIDTVTTNTSFNYSGKIGFQIGSGYRFTEQLSVDLSYRIINAESKIKAELTSETLSQEELTFVREVANRTFEEANGDVQLASSIQIAAKYTF